MPAMPEIAALAAIGLAIVASAPARADFVVTNSTPSGVPTGQAAQGQVRPGGAGVVADTPHVDPDDRKPVAPPSRPRAAPPRVVQGFGENIPLSFARRQILPPNVKVIYGTGADPGMLVTWKGSDTWPRVLSSAIKPLGLHMVQSGVTLRIEG
jgi:hypothetical protein